MPVGEIKNVLLPPKKFSANVNWTLRLDCGGRGPEMSNKDIQNSHETLIQGMLSRYLPKRNAGFANIKGPHLDEDALAAFTEGTVNEREAGPMITHLVDCSFCRHVTADLIRLNAEFADETIPAVPASEPAGISEVLSGLFSKIFGTTDGAVFAHNEDEEEESSEDEEEERIEN
jgi:hypothetical protein